MHVGPIPDGWEVHHRDRDPSNNDLANLECLPPAEHHALHDAERVAHRVVDGREERRCQRCDEWKPLDCYTVRHAGTYHGYCKPCALAYVREWRARNAEHVKAERKRRYHEIELPARRAASEYTRGPYATRP